MGNKESNESAAVKRQAEGGANPMYLLLDLSGISGLLHSTLNIIRDLLEIGSFLQIAIYLTPYMMGHHCKMLRQSISAMLSS